MLIFLSGTGRSRFSNPIVARSAVLSLAVLVLGSGLSVLPAQQREASQWVVHTLEVLAGAATLEADLAMVANEGQAFLVDHTDESVQSFELTSRQVVSDLTTLRTLAAENPGQQARLDRLTPLTSAYIGFLRGLIERAQTGDEPGLMQLFRTQRGRSLMNQILETVAELKAEERRLLVMRDKVARLAMQRTIFGLIGCATVAASSLFGGILLLSRRRQRYYLSKIRKQMTTLSAVLDACPVAIIIANSEGKIVRDNAANRAIWGNPPQTTSWEQYGNWIGWWPESGARIKPEEWGLTRALVQGEIVTGELVECEQFGTGKRRFFLNNAAPLRNAEGRVIGAISAKLDVTEAQQAELRLRKLTETLELRVVAEVAEREKAEAVLRHAQKMETIGRIAAGVAHDFNNILQSVMGGLELVLHELAPHLPAHEYAQLAFRASRRGSYLTHHLLSYARKQVLRPQNVALASFLGEMQGLLARTLGPHIRVQVSAETAVLIHADPGQLQTALLNLALNAAYAMPKGGTLTLEACAASDGKHCLITVADTGTGMNEATLAQVFEPFFTTKGVEGTGLGCSMVQGFAEQSKGTVRIASTLGQGTMVELSLPLAVPLISMEIPQSRGDEGMQLAGRVLLVDDDPDVLVTINAFMTQAGLRVELASSGDEALNMLSKGERFDALITDFAMPGLNGVDLIAQALLLQPELPVLIITGFAETWRNEELLKETRRLHKPFLCEQLVTTLREMMERGGPVSPDTVSAAPSS